MLYLIGIGLREKDVTLAALDAMKECDKVYSESYTGMTSPSYLESMTNKKISPLDRTKVESDFLIKEAEQSKIALLVPGDPLTATTHMELIMEAKKLGIETEVVHAPSIFTAVAECGLHMYKFGRTTTLARPLENYHPESPYDVIVENKKHGMHTLMLLEIDMQASEAVGILKQIEEKKKCNVLGEKIVVMHFGEKNQILYAKPDDVSVEAPCCLIFPAELHFTEESTLSLWE